MLVRHLHQQVTEQHLGQFDRARPGQQGALDQPRHQAGQGRHQEADREAAGRQGEAGAEVLNQLLWGAVGAVAVPRPAGARR
jgi:hypothetical protein